MTGRQAGLPVSRYARVHCQEPKTEQQRQLANSSNSDSDNEDEQQENDLCSKCLQKNRLLTEVCIQCRLFYHKKCEKIRYIPVKGWICSKCKSKKT